jgi:hypothetical protein
MKEHSQEDLIRYRMERDVAAIPTSAKSNDS